MFVNFSSVWTFSGATNTVHHIGETPVDVHSSASASSQHRATPVVAVLRASSMQLLHSLCKLAETGEISLCSRGDDGVTDIVNHTAEATFRSLSWLCRAPST